MALYITASGVKFTSHGSGDNPIFKGSVNVQGMSWVNEGSGIYSLETGFDVKWLFIDGQNAKQASTDWIDVDALPSSTSVTVDAADLTGLDVVGAYISQWNRPYSRSRGHLVTGYAAGVITHNRAHGYLDRSWRTLAQQEDDVDGRIKLYGLSSYITDNYDWAFEDGTLYVKLPSAPSGFVIRAVREDAAIKVKAADFEIENIEIKDYHRAGIAIYAGGENAHIHDCEIHDIREDGIRIPDRNDGIQILDNEIHHCDVRGIYIANCDNWKANRNEIHHIAVGVNDAWLKDSMDTNHYAMTGITQSSGQITTGSQFVDGSEINDNYIHDIGWCGVHYFKGNGVILRNRVEDTMQTMDDGGAIYLAWGLWDYPTATYSVEVAYNRIRGIPVQYWDDGHGMVIYQDNGSGANEVHHNVCWDAKGQALFGDLFANQGSAFQNWHHNIVVSKKGHCLAHWFADNVGNPGIQAQGVQMYDNVFVSLVANKECLEYVGNAFVSGGGADRNYYFNPYSAGDVADDNLNLASWQALYSQDANARSKSNWLTYVNESTAENTHIKLYVNHTGEDVEQLIPAGYEDIDGNNVGGQTLTVPAYYGLLVLKTTN